MPILPTSEPSSSPTLDQLTQPGILGFYTHVEVTEVFGIRGRGAAPVNVLTLVIREGGDKKRTTVFALAEVSIHCQTASKFDHLELSFSFAV